MGDFITLSTREEYDYLLRNGIDALTDLRFEMDINLRIAVQHELFGTREDVQRANERFYRWVWEHKPHYCEETMQPLREYSAVYVSHILTRGAHPEMAHDPRNVNLLCFDMHNKWENGKREEMRIYKRNQEIIERLKREYNAIK